MNPYVSFGLVMCGIVLVSLAATAYMAVAFNRRAKADLTAALTPLAAAIGGELDIDEASVQGRYAGHIVGGRMTNATDGAGRVFRTEIVDSAGGVAWQFLSEPARRQGESPAHRFESSKSELAEHLKLEGDARLAAVVDSLRDRFRLDYDPETGRLRFERAMRTRKEIPDDARFRRQLDLLVALGQANRRAQGAPDDDVV